MNVKGLKVKQKLLEDLQQLRDQKLLHISKLQQQHEEEETMLMDKTRFDNEVYATGLQVAMAGNYYMDPQHYVCVNRKL